MKRPYYGWILAIVLGFTSTVSWGVLYYAFSVLIPPITEELGWSRAQTSGALSVMLVVSGLAGLAVGRWLDERGPRLLTGLGAVVVFCFGAARIIQLRIVAGRARRKGPSTPPQAD